MPSAVALLFFSIRLLGSSQNIIMAGTIMPGAWQNKCMRPTYS